MPRSRKSLRLPTRTLSPLIDPSIPNPGIFWKSVAVIGGSWRLSASCTMARASGCVEKRATAAAIESAAFSLPPSRMSIFDTTNAPFVSVPVLSKANWLTPARFSMATPPRNKMPFRAPAAIATRIADGIDKTSAQGEATTSKVMVR